MALYDFRTLNLTDQTYVLEDYKLEFNLCEMLEDCGGNSFAFLKQNSSCSRLSEHNNLYASNVSKRGNTV